MNANPSLNLRWHNHSINGFSPLTTFKRVGTFETSQVANVGMMLFSFRIPNDSALTAITPFVNYIVDNDFTLAHFSFSIQSCVCKRYSEQRSYRWQFVYWNATVMSSALNSVCKRYSEQRSYRWQFVYWNAPS